MSRRFVGEFIPAYRKRRIKADEERRARAIEKERKTERERHEGQEYSDRKQIVATFQRIDDEAKRYAEQQQTDTDRAQGWEWRKFWIDVAAVTAAFFAAFFFFRQLNIMKGQLDEMRNEQRPWVSAEAAIAAPLTFSKKIASTALLVRLKNTGHTPAFSVHVKATALPIVGEAKIDCAAPPDTINFGINVFPGDTPVLLNEIHIEIGEQKVFWPILVACVFYRFPGESEWHRTPSVYHLQMRSDAVLPGHGCCAFAVNDGDIPTTSLELQQFPVGWEPPT